VIGSACSGHGFKFAPAIGARLAALAVQDMSRDSPQDMSLSFRACPSTSA
jgi:glycine/D-amino acid oxidase-like deaminating enzyme